MGFEEMIDRCSFFLFAYKTMNVVRNSKRRENMEISRFNIYVIFSLTIICDYVIVQ